MKVTKEILQHMAKISRITLTDEEIEKFIPQMQTILDSVKTLDEVDVKGVILKARRRTTLSDLRDDTPRDSISQEDALKNAKFKKNGMVLVPGSTTESVEA